MISLAKNIKKNSGYFGQKTIKLLELKELGFSVPDFVAISTNVLKKIISDNGVINDTLLNKLVGEINDKVNYKLFAIRSSALIEDSFDASYAGQFKTVIGVNNNKLFTSLQEVILQAYHYFGGSIDRFSIIIQEFIEADYSGVTFTRSPFGNREMIIEYIEGRGEKLVGGESKANKYSFYWNEVPLASYLLSKFDISIFKRIEKHYKQAQDIEWCVKNKKLYIVQTRAITSFTDNDYEQALYLDKVLANKNKFYLQQTEISEIAARPKPITLDLLKIIYGSGGPIESVYKKFKIKYEARDFLEIIGNQLYVNKEEELKTIFPAKSYLHSSDFTPEIVNLAGFIRTFKNSLNLNKIATSGYIHNIQSLVDRVNLNTDNINEIDKCLDLFLKDYKVVFEINLLAGISLEKLKQFIFQYEKINIAKLLYCFESDYLGDVIGKLDASFPNQTLVGNSLDVSDESIFEKNIKINTASKQSLINYLNKLNVKQKEKIMPFIQEAVIFNYLREYGRWLVVLRINKLRKILLSMSEKRKLIDEKSIYFAKFNELIGQNIDKNKLSERMKSYFKYDKFTLENTLTSSIVTSNKSEPIGVSRGVATGRLLELSDIQTSHKKNILYVEILSPDLVEYFNKVEAIVSKSGGLLSHLSIMAREKNIPVIVGVDLHSLNISLGDQIEVNGGNGIIKKIK